MQRMLGIAVLVGCCAAEPAAVPVAVSIETTINDSYKVTAQFLAYLVEKYDKEIVRKLNKTMREGEYKDEIWQSLTKKSLKGLGEEWKESLKPKSSTETGALDR